MKSFVGLWFCSFSSSHSLASSGSVFEEKLAVLILSDYLTCGNGTVI